MEAIKYYVKGAFLGIVETPAVLEQQEELIADMSAKLDDLVAEGKSAEEALGMAIASMGDLSALVREFATDEPAAPVAVAPAEEPVRTVEVAASKLELHTTLLSVGGALAVLFVLSVMATAGGAMSSETAVWDLFLGFAAVTFMGNALVRFHEHAGAVETVAIPGKAQIKKAIVQWGAVCAVAFVANFIANGSFWAWTVWIAGAAWPARVIVQKRMLEAGKFVIGAPAKAAEQPACACGATSGSCA